MLGARTQDWAEAESALPLLTRACPPSRGQEKHVSRDGAGIPLMLQHYWWGEEALIKNGLPLTVLRANFFMNHLLKTDCENIDAEGWFSNPLGEQRNSFVCTNDIAEAAAVCITEGPERQCAAPLSHCHRRDRTPVA